MIYREFSLNDARIRAYVLSNFKDIDLDRRRPMVIICPGGAYIGCSEREAEAVAIRFNSLGYNALNLFYSVNPRSYENGVGDVRQLFPKPQKELAHTVAYVREHAKEFNTDPDRIVVLGFSAGGHLAASLGVFWPEFGEKSRPDALVLCYPVITSGTKCHIGSIRNLIGMSDELREKVSLEKHVTKNTPPTFLWATRNDNAVPFENSVFFKEALDRAGVANELVLYDNGVHGLSLGNREVLNWRMEENPEVQDWPERADRFITKVLGPKYKCTFSAEVNMNH